MSMKDNLGFMADTQRLLLNSFKVQQQQYTDIEKKLKLDEPPVYSQRNYVSPGQQPQYPPIPPLPPLPYGQPINQG